MVFCYYLFCPGGAEPAGFWFSVCCVNPLPEQVGYWPPGWLPPLLVQLLSTCVIAADAGVVSSGAIIATNATATAAMMTDVVFNIGYSQLTMLRQIYKDP